MSRTMKELREAQGLTYKALAARVNSALRDWIEDVLRSQGEDMRVAWRQRDELVERFRVVPKTLERWEKVGFGVQRGTRATHTFYLSPTFVVLGKVLAAEPGDMDKESRNATLQPGDTVVRPTDEEGYPAFGEGATDTVRYLVVPDGFGGTFLKEERDVTNADHEAIRIYLEEETQFLNDKSEKFIDAIVRDEAANMDEVIRRLREEEHDG
jgi:hypothetical protein